VLLPSDSFIGDQMVVVEPEAIFRAREALRQDLGKALATEWRAAYEGSLANRFEYSPAAKGARRLKTVSLGYIAASGWPMPISWPSTSSAAPTT
jgi:aminopeptidase N